jgi:hypothetical protein
MVTCLSPACPWELNVMNPTLTLFSKLCFRKSDHLGKWEPKNSAKLSLNVCSEKLDNIIQSFCRGFEEKIGFDQWDVH